MPRKHLTYSRIGSSAALLRHRVSVLGGGARSKRNLNRPNARTCLSPSPNAQIIDNLAVIASHSRTSLLFSVMPALGHYVCALSAKSATNYCRESLADRSPPDAQC